MERISFEIKERLAETRIPIVANMRVDAMPLEMYNEIAIRLRAQIVDYVIWSGTTNEWKVPATGIWNNILHRIPFGWAQRRVKRVKFRQELHIHHNCPHITIPIDSREHFEWMRQGQ